MVSHSLRKFKRGGRKNTVTNPKINGKPWVWLHEREPKKYRYWKKPYVRKRK